MHVLFLHFHLLLFWFFLIFPLILDCALLCSIVYSFHTKCLPFQRKWVQREAWPPRQRPSLLIYQGTIRGDYSFTTSCINTTSLQLKLRFWDLFSPDTGNNINTFRLNAVHTVEPNCFQSIKEKYPLLAAKAWRIMQGRIRFRIPLPWPWGGGVIKAFKMWRRKSKEGDGEAFLPFSILPLFPPALRPC